MNVDAMLNGSEMPKKRKGSAHVQGMLNNSPPSRGNSRTSSRTASISSKPKPKRYSEPPIWAQSFKTWRKKSGISADFTPPAQDSQAIGNGPGGVPSLLGIPASISGIVPAENLTRTISKWLYGHLYNLQDKRQYIEVEFKLGTACDKTNNKRIRLPLLTEAILENNYVKDQVYFEPGIAQNYFGRIESMVNGFVASHTLEFIGEQKTRDQFHPTEGGATVRVTLDDRDQLLQKITKQRVGDLIIFFPTEDIDLRISLSLEVPFEGSPQDVKPPNLVRNKNRVSWRTKGLQLDMTNVTTPGKPSTKEVELELDASIILDSYSNYESKKDTRAMDKFEELLRFSLDSCRVLTRGASSG